MLARVVTNSLSFSALVSLGRLPRNNTVLFPVGFLLQTSSQSPLSALSSCYYLVLALIRNRVLCLMGVRQLELMSWLSGWSGKTKVRNTTHLISARGLHGKGFRGHADSVFTEKQGRNHGNTLGQTKEGVWFD